MTIFQLEQQLNVNTHRFYPSSSMWVIYLLVRENHIVYIGKSSIRRYLSRIRSHTKDKVFDCYHVLPVEMSEFECYKFESSLISLIRPEYNKKDVEPNVNTVIEGVTIFSKSLQRDVSKIAKGNIFNGWLIRGTIFVLFYFSILTLHSLGVHEWRYSFEIIFTIGVLTNLSGLNAIYYYYKHKKIIQPEYKSM